MAYVNEFVKMCNKDKFKDLKETENIKNDPFFKPKNIEKRDEEIKGQREKIVCMMKRGLEKIKMIYEQKGWETENEKSFLKIFHDLQVNTERQGSLMFVNSRNNAKVGFDYAHKAFYGMYYYTWQIGGMEGTNSEEYGMLLTFIKRMIKKYFDLPDVIIW